MGGMVPAVVGLWVTVLGVGLSLVALGLVALVGAGLRTGGVRLPRFPLAEPLDREGGSPSGEAAAGVLLLRPGGQVVYASTQARTWFGLQPGEPPHLENLARRVRPVEEFLRLCAVPGQGEVTLARRMFTVISFPLPTVEGAAMALLLRPVSWMPGASSEASDGEAVLERLTTLSRALTDTLGVEETLQAIFQVVDRLLPTDYIEITLWDEETQTLRPYRFVGLAGMEHHLERPQERYPRGEGLTGYLMTHREPLLIPDIRHAEHPALAVSTHRLPAGARAYLGVPLLVGDTVLGTLELAADEAGAFDVGSLRLMQWVAEQAAAALHRALAYTKVQAQVEQLQAQVTVLRSVAALHDAEAFVRHLVEGMHTLTGARLVGLLLYREGSRVLEAQWPFLGVPRAFVDSYRAPLPDDPAVWAPLEKPFWTPNAVEDAWFQRVGLADLARGAGIHDTLVLPLRTEERFLGVLQLSNRADRPFGSEDLALAEAMARQIASVLENFVLLQAQRERAYRAEALRRIANLVASEATLDETFRFVLQELSRLLKASWAAVFLLDESRGVLEVHRPSVVGVAPEVVTRLGQLSVQDPSFAYTVTRTRRPFLSRDIQGDPRIAAWYRPLVEALPEVRSVLVVPLSVRDRGVGELLLGSPYPGAFQRSDVQLVASVAGQLALAIEQERLLHQSDHALAARAEQMQALLRLSRELTLAPSLERLLEHLRREVVHLTAADCATLRLLTPEGEVAEQHQLLCAPEQDAGLSPRERQALEQGEALVFAALTEEEQPHPGVRSALVVPLVYRHRPIGVLDLHAHTVQAFDEEQIRFAQGVGLQAALAVGLHREREAQVRQMAQWQQRLAAIGLIREFLASHPVSESPEALLLELTGLVMQGVGASGWALYAYDETSGMLLPLGSSEPWEVRPEPLVWDRLAAHLEPVGAEGIYRLPPSFRAEVPWLEDTSQEQTAAGWVMPIRSAEKALLGVVMVRPPDETAETLDAVGASLSMTAPVWGLLFQWAQVHRAHQDATRGLEEALRQTETALQAAEAGVRRWLHKDLEQMVDTNALARSKERLEVALAIATIVNRQPDRQAVFDALGHELLERLAMEVVVVVEQVGGQLRLRQVYGTVPEGIRLESLLGQRNPIPEALRMQQAILIGDLQHEATPWQDAPLLRRLQARAVLTLPIGIEEQPMAVALAVSGNSLPPFSNEDVQAFTLLGRQVGIALQNLRLLNEVTRRLEEVDLLLGFSRQLGELDLERLLNNLLESALAVIHRAHAGFVALWDEQHRVLRLQAAQGYGSPEALVGVALPVEGLLGEAFRTGQVQRIDEVDFVRTYPFDQEALLRYQQATLNRLPVSALMIPIASGEQVLGVVVVENFNTLAAFQESDENLLLALARQTGLMLENARLLEDAQTRAGQLQALTNVAAIITSTLQTEEVVASLLPQLATALPYDAATVWMREAEDVFVVQNARGFPDEEERRGVRVALKDSALLQVIVTTEEPLLVSDTHEDTRFPWPEAYPYRSWLGLPLISQGEVMGVIVLEKAEPRFFTAERVEIARTFAAQAAAALQNARLYEESLHRAQELHERTARLELVYSFTAELGVTLNPEHILSLTLRRLREALPLERVGVVVEDREGQLTLVMEEPASGPVPRLLPALELVEQMAESKGVVLSLDPLHDERLAPWREELTRGGSARAVVLFPLVTREILHGVVVVQVKAQAALSPAELDLGRTLTQQAAVAYQNARLYEEMRRLTQELERRVAERTRELTQEHRRAQILLRIITELASSLDLDQVLNRTLDLMNETLGAEQSTILLHRPDERYFYLRAARGYTDSPPPGGRPTALSVEQSLAGWVLRHREPVLVPDLHDDPRWKPGPEGLPPHRAAIVVPLQVGEDVLGAFCLFHRQPGYFSLDHLDLAMAAGRQVAVAINNAELFNLIRDQSERLGQEVRRREVEASRARAILESVADGIVVTDARGKVTLFNPSAERLLGIAAERILGQPLERFSGLFGAAAGEWLSKVKQWSENPGLYQSGEVYEQRLDLEDGRVLSVRLTPVLTSREFLGTVSVFRDITHQVEVDRLKSEFVATVSHELRTPMTAIKGYVELLLKGVAGPLNEQQLRFLEIVHTNTERLSSLVSDLLDISRIEAGKITFVPEEVDLAELVSEVLTEARRLAEEDGRAVTFVAELPPDLPPVWADRERLYQILANLVDNGYRYTPDGGRVLVRARRQGEEVQVDVVDNGIGIPPDEQERVFERFYRGEHPLVMASAGTGLGLSIVRTLVEMHGGQIWVESDGIPGKGSTFSFTLPVAEGGRLPAEGG